mmetsp:Transcript_19996/g.28727  ORF Transcript_19996/g.28727 Transcript_19996/m.28727 type:complete len:269 (-) Transcript_19996:171-977(-)
MFKRDNNSGSDNDTVPLIMSKSAGAADDPFYAVRDNVQTYVDRIKIRHEKFQDLVFNSNTANNSEFKDVRKGLIKDIRTADKQIKDLKGAVEMADRNRDKFQHISDSELGQRKKFVEEMSKEISDVRASMESPSVRRKLEDDENKAKRSVHDESLGAVTGMERENTQFIRGQQQMTKDMIGQQDVQLDSLGQAVDRLGGMGKTINTELKEQNKLLDELDRDLDDAGEKMNFVMAKLSKLLKTKDGCQIWTIVILAVVLVILVALTIFL